LLTQLYYVETSSGTLITNQVFADTAYFLLNQLISLTCQIFDDIAYTCTVITTYLCCLIEFYWHSIFCWISWFLLKQQISAYSAIFCWVIIRHQQVFADTAYFFAESAHFADLSIFFW